MQGKTIHGSKGLEARVVFIIGLTDGSGGFTDVWLMDRIYTCKNNLKLTCLIVKAWSEN